MLIWKFKIILACSIAAASCGQVWADSGFDREIAPILTRRCLGCHSGAEPKGGLDLSRRASALKGGENGPALVPGSLEESLAWEQVDGDAMPPKKPLSADEKARLRAWIAGGARWGTDPIDTFDITTDQRAGRDWWAFQQAVRPIPPAMPAKALSPIDAFLSAELGRNGLAFSPLASRRELIRRLSFDLLGLPPTPEEVLAFELDAHDDAYERLADRLLASPMFGARWGRLWLDLARFGESHGFEHDEFRPNAWPYRDWVIDALNRNMPYDEFVRLQIAGDVLHPNDPGSNEATGFLVAGAYDSVGQGQQSAVMKRVVRQDELEDVVGTVGQTFLGLTVHCARCHDHKFDPIPQRDYYRLSAALAGVRHGEREVGPDKQKAYVVSPRPPEQTRLLIRGNAELPGDVMTPGGVSALDGLDSDLGLPADGGEGERRVRLAAWITNPRNPLTPRVIVNRLWQAHFGVGFVSAPSDFGFNGGPPTHPQLLDWLASELVESGWNLKHVHRLIVTSHAYRQASRSEENGMKLDAENRLLWRKSPLRLEAEMVRDAMLAVSGALNPAMGGPGFHEYAVSKAVGTITNRYTPVEPDGPEFDRRTIYRTWARGGRNGFLDAFDCPDPSTVAPRRASTTTPLQALALLNNALTLRLADRFAERLLKETGHDPARQVERAYWLAFGREPAGEEKAAAIGLVQAHGAAALARALFNSNEFLYID